MASFSIGLAMSDQDKERLKRFLDQRSAEGYKKNHILSRWILERLEKEAADKAVS